MGNIMRFRTNSKVKSLFGKDLITNNNIAIFELVKNAYDAGANNVQISFKDFEITVDKENKIQSFESNEKSTIEVEDDGDGMTLEEIRKYWMELGTPHKETNKDREFKNDKIEKIYSRTVNGDKGIGRFGVDKISEKLILESIGKNEPDMITRVTFDWGKFDDRSKMLQDIEIPFEREVVSRINSQTGLLLKLLKLRENWTEKSLVTLEKSLSKFLSPRSSSTKDDKFSIIFRFINDEELMLEKKITNNTFDYLSTKIDSILSKDGVISYSIIDSGKKIFASRELLFPDGSPFGEVNSEIYYLNQPDKSLFTRKMGLRTSDYGNIRLYKDGFRVMPYGEPHNDWLEIDKNHAQGIFRSFGTRDMVGNIYLKNKHLTELNVLNEATDRVGLIEDNAEFDFLKELCWFQIKALEDYVFDKTKKEIKKENAELNEDTSELKLESILTLDNIVTQLKNSSIEDKTFNKIEFEINQSKEKMLEKFSDLDRLSKRIDKKVKLYSQIASKEGFLYDVLHSVKNKLSIIEAQISLLDFELEQEGIDFDSSVIKNSYSDVYKLVESALDRVNLNKTEKTRFNICSTLNRVISEHEAILQEKNIRLEYDNLLSDVTLYGVESAIKIVFENLFNNSIKVVPKDEGIIKISVRSFDDQLNIVFNDNGPGVPEEKIRSIFTLWNSESSGTGIGLATVKDTILEHDGSVNIAKNTENNEYYNGATFVIKLPVRGAH